MLTKRLRVYFLKGHLPQSAAMIALLAVYDTYAVFPLGVEDAAGDHRHDFNRAGFGYAQNTSYLYYFPLPSVDAVAMNPARQ